MLRGAVLRVPSAIILGLSMGSQIALNFAVNYPQRVRALVLRRSIARCFS